MKNINNLLKLTKTVEQFNDLMDLFVLAHPQQSNNKDEYAFETYKQLMLDAVSNPRKISVLREWDKEYPNFHHQTFEILNEIKNEKTSFSKEMFNDFIQRYSYDHNLLEETINSHKIEDFLTLLAGMQFSYNTININKLSLNILKNNPADNPNENKKNIYNWIKENKAWSFLNEKTLIQDYNEYLTGEDVWNIHKSVSDTPFSNNIFSSKLISLLSPEQREAYQILSFLKFIPLGEEQIQDKFFKDPDVQVQKWNNFVDEEGNTSWHLFAKKNIHMLNQVFFMNKEEIKQKLTRPNHKGETPANIFASEFQKSYVSGLEEIKKETVAIIQECITEPFSLNITTGFPHSKDLCESLMKSKYCSLSINPKNNDYFSLMSKSDSIIKTINNTPQYLNKLDNESLCNYEVLNTFLESKKTSYSSIEGLATMISDNCLNTLNKYPKLQTSDIYLAYLKIRDMFVNDPYTHGYHYFVSTEFKLDVKHEINKQLDNVFKGPLTYREQLILQKVFNSEKAEESPIISRRKRI